MLTLVMVKNSALEAVDAYVYPGLTVQLGRFNFKKEVNRLIQLGSVVSLRNRIRNEELHRRTRVADIAKRIS